jgi:hypothetical protein
VTKPRIVKDGSIHMNGREFSDIEILNIREREYRCLCPYYVINAYASLMYELKQKLERYLRVNLLGPGPSSHRKIIYRAAVSQRLRNTDVGLLLPAWTSFAVIRDSSTMDGTVLSSTVDGTVLDSV